MIHVDRLEHAPLPEIGTVAPHRRVPVLRVGCMDMVGSNIQNSYFQELLGPRTFGSMLNVGAGSGTINYDVPSMFAAAEFHTLETPDAKLAATYLNDAADMRDVPSERYDWVMSNAVLEHVPDPWAVAREKTRVAKTGGYIVVSVPFSCVMHPGAHFGDYWRFSPQGVMKLFPECSVVEIEFWGDDPHLPASIALILRKGPSPASPRYYWFDMEPELPWDCHIGTNDTELAITVYEITVEPMSLAAQLNDAKDQQGMRGKLNLPQKAIARGLAWQYSHRIGYLGFRGAMSFFRRDSTEKPVVRTF